MKAWSVVPGNLPYLKRYLLTPISEIFRTARGGREYFLPIFLLILLFTLPKPHFHVSLSTLYQLLIFHIMGGKGPTVSKEPSMHSKCYTTNSVARRHGRHVPLPLSHSKAVLDPCVGVAPCMHTAASPGTLWYWARLTLLAGVSSLVQFYLNHAGTTLNKNNE